jgi:hypothetical protein
MEEGVSQGCPLSPIFASLVVAHLLQPLDTLLKLCAAACLLDGHPGDDGKGSITHLLGYVDDVSTCVPHVDLKFLCDNYASIGAPLGCFVNPMKTRILTSTSGLSPLPNIHLLNPSLDTCTQDTIAYRFTKPNNNDILGQPSLLNLPLAFASLALPLALQILLVNTSMPNSPTSRTELS